VYGKIKLPRPVDAVIEEMRGPGPTPRPHVKRARR
jgi:hypothetical protein